MDSAQNTSNCCFAEGKCCDRANANKLNTFDWLGDIPGAECATNYVEVQFKNTRKGYFVNETGISLKKGDIVAVEAMPGHDIGMISLTGQLVLFQMRKNNIREDGDIKKVYRIARQNDIEKYKEAKEREYTTMIHSRQIAEDLHLAMKIGDVEYQGDGNKAIFYYIADERVDFRQLIKVLADTFKVRIEMKQIGARQEAGRIGGIGPCGLELCCASWMTNFVSVSTDAARFQDISMNPQKLAGQCAKLKCCINYEVDSYVEAQKQLPSRKISLETQMGVYYHFKTDILKKEITYSTDKSLAVNLVVISSDRAFEVIKMNRNGIKPESLDTGDKIQSVKKQETHDILGDSVSRFDSIKKKKKKRHGNHAQSFQGKNANHNHHPLVSHTVKEQPEKSDGENFKHNHDKND